MVIKVARLMAMLLFLLYSSIQNVLIGSINQDPLIR